MLQKITISFLFLCTLVACTSKPQVVLEPKKFDVTGVWITEPDGSNMPDSQPSGLSYSERGLFTISDGSALESQIKQLHQLDPNTGEIIDRLGPIELSEKLSSSCFASYLLNRPDYEAIVAHPSKANTWLIVTEDARTVDVYPDECAQKYVDTGSTDFPTLIVQVEYINESIQITGIRPIQFDSRFEVGNFANDGIEAMTIAKDGTVYIGLEKDSQTQARIFSFQLTDDLFNSENFLAVDDAELLLPKYSEGNHPINGMDIYYPYADDRAYLILAARNDNQLWIVDTQRENDTKIINMEFNSPCGLPSQQKNTPYKIDIPAIEGVAVQGSDLYLINDPWKKMYPSNTKLEVCPEDEKLYNSFSPLLFKMTIPNCFVSGFCQN